MIYLQVGALFCKLVNPTSKRSGTCKDRRSADKALRLASQNPKLGCEASGRLDSLKPLGATGTLPEYIGRFQRSNLIYRAYTRIPEASDWDLGSDVG